MRLYVFVDPYSLVIGVVVVEHQMGWPSWPWHSLIGSIPNVVGVVFYRKQRMMTFGNYYYWGYCRWHCDWFWWYWWWVPVPEVVGGASWFRGLRSCQSWQQEKWERREVEAWAIVLWTEVPEVPGAVAEPTLVPVPWLLPWTKEKRRRRKTNRPSMAWVLISNADLLSWHHCYYCYYHVKTEDSMLGDTFGVVVGVAVDVDVDGVVAVAAVQCYCCVSTTQSYCSRC
eukprot:scaffold28221_cov59-Attheya_sp.AAC.8